MAIQINLKDYSKKKLKELEEILTYNYSNPFGKDITIFAWNAVSQETLNIPYTIARKYLGVEPKKRKPPKNYQPWKFLYSLRSEPSDQKTLDKEAFPVLKKHGSICLFLPCSWGKTIQSISMASRLDQGGKVVVISSYSILTGYSKDKCGQWKDAFEECTDAKTFFLRKPTKTKTWENEQKEANVLIGMPGSIKYLLNKEVDVLILDEAHTLCTSNFVEKVLEILPKYVIILTATPERDDEMDCFLHAVGGGKKQQFIRKSNKPFKIFPLTTGFSDEDVEFGEESEESEEPGDENEDPEDPEDQGEEPKTKKSLYEIQKKIKENMRKGITRVNLESKLAFLPERNKEIIDFIEYIHENTNFKLAVVGDRVNQLSSLYDECVERDIDVAGLWGNRKSVENSRVLILGLKKSGTGFDEKAFIENWDGKRIDLMLFTISTYKIIQVLGRALRASHPIVIQMIDKDKKNWFIKTWRDNKKTYADMDGLIQANCDWKTIREKIKQEEDGKGG